MDVSPAAPDWTILRKSLEFELKMGCMNFEVRFRYAAILFTRNK